jgi:hypothetical protein
MKIINSRLHGIIDYLVVLFLWASPTLFGLTGFTGNIIYGLGGIHLILTIVTDFELGLIKWIPLKIHGWIELVVGLVLLASPWILGVSENAVDRNFLLGFGAAVLLVWLLTSYQSAKVTA